MKDKKRSSIIVIIILVIVAIVSYWFLQKTPPSVSVDASATQTFANDSSLLSKKPHSPSPKFVPKTPKQKHWLEMGTQIDVQEVNFYGHVVDQNNQPVAGAVVVYELGGGALTGSNGVGRRQTDANGDFSITGRDASLLSINSIAHSEIEFSFPIPEYAGTYNSPNAGSMTIYGFQPRTGAKEILWSDTSPKNPYVFKAWRIGEKVGATAKNLKVGKYGKSFEFDKIYTLDLFKPIMEVAMEGERDGQLRIIFHGKADSEGVTQRWEAHIIPVNGGIQVTNDPYMNMAPEAGYEPEIHIVREKLDDRYIDGLSNQQYFFTANNGQVYGSLFARFYAKGRDGQLSFDINYKINPDGERILIQAKSKR